MKVTMRKGKKCISIAFALVALAILNSADRDSTNEGYEMIDSREQLTIIN